MEEEWKRYNATFFFFRVPETIVDIFLVFEFQLSLSFRVGVAAIQGVNDSSRLLISSVNSA